MEEEEEWSGEKKTITLPVKKLHMKVSSSHTTIGTLKMIKVVQDMQKYKKSSRKQSTYNS
jgi:hypothetical protein